MMSLLFYRFHISVIHKADLINNFPTGAVFAGHGV